MKLELYTVGQNDHDISGNDYHQHGGQQAVRNPPYSPHKQQAHADKDFRQTHKLLLSETPDEQAERAAIDDEEYTDSAIPVRAAVKGPG